MEDGPILGKRVSVADDEKDLKRQKRDEEEKKEEMPTRRSSRNVGKEMCYDIDKIIDAELNMD